MKSGDTTAFADPEVTTLNPRRYWVLVTIGVGNLMSTMDSSIVNTLLPAMRLSLHTSVAAIEWVMTIYLLVLTGLLLAFGRLGDLQGHKKVYVSGFAAFVVSSALCSLSPSAPWLIFFRALQALASAMIFANSPAIVASSFPANERGHAFGLQSAMTYIGYSVGPPLGGLLATHFGWRSVFYINVPVGLLGLYMSYTLIAPDRPEGEAPPFDLLGAVLFFFGLFALLLALNQGYAWGWDAPLTLGLLGVAVVLLGIFFAVERRRKYPMLDLSLFSRPVFTGSVFSSMLNYAANSAIYFVLPFYLISSRGLNPQQTGISLVAMPIVMMVVAPVSGSLSDRLGSRWPTIFGLTLLVLGLLALSRIVAPIPLWQISAALVLCGIGFGAFIPPNNSRLLGAAPPNRQGIASGVLAGARCLGMVLGVGVAGAVYTTVLHHQGPQAVGLGASMALKVTAGISSLAILTSWLEGELPGERPHGTGPVVER